MDSYHIGLRCNYIRAANKILTNIKIQLAVTAIAGLLILTFVYFQSTQIWIADDPWTNPDCLGLCYQEFKINNITNVVPDGKDVEFDGQGNLSRVQCRFHAVQLAIFTSESPSKLLYGIYKIPGTLILQMRHDGLIGLPGGGVRIGESLTTGLYRESKEELGINLDSYTNLVKYLISYSDPRRKYCGHLFGLQVSWDKLRSIIVQATQISDLGLENLGYFLMPSINEVKDGGGFDGLPNFIGQSIIVPQSPPNMVGNTLQQIIYVLTSATNPPILSQQSFDRTLKLTQKLLTITSERTNNKNSFIGGTHFDHFYE